ncbi:MAG: hypothetical protein EBS29_07510 [Chloroflexia bacterium]|nr:hypothetical protein [Chloroflexia bacterium]
MTTVAIRTKPTAKKSRKQHSMWLMLGGASLLSIFGWAFLTEQNTPLPAATAALNLQVVDLPTAVPQVSGPIAPTHPNAAQARPNQDQVARPSSPLRHVTRPVLRSHSSN